MLKAVIFDVGGVLIRTEDRSSRAGLEDRLGLERGQADMLYFNGDMGRQAQLGQISTAALLDDIQARLNLDTEGIAAFRHEFWAGDLLDTPLVDYIQSLRPHYITAIISNWADNLLEMITDEYPMADAFDLIVTSAGEKVMKPDAAIFERTVERLGIAPHEAVFIDDFAHNIEGARAAGLAAIHFTPGIDLPAELEKLGVFVPTALDQRFETRACTRSDIPALVELTNAHSQALLGEDSVMVEEMETEYKNPQFNPATDTFVMIERETGRFAAYIECWNDLEPYVETYAFIRIHPDFEGSGLGGRALKIAEGRSRLTLHKTPPDAYVFTLVATDLKDKFMHQLFQDNGYQETRLYLRMLIEMAELPEEPEFPKGITWRTYRPEDFAKMVAAVEEAFADHWGNFDEPLEKALAKWQTFTEDPTFDPEVWLIAFDGDEIAGVSVCWTEMAESPEMGLVDHLGVRRPWRRRGLAYALLRQSFRELYKKGKSKVRLGVDATSLTNAAALYEKAGMHVITKTGLYEKEIRPGIDLRKQTLES